MKLSQVPAATEHEVTHIESPETPESRSGKSSRSRLDGVLVQFPSMSIAWTVPSFVR